MRKVSCKMSSPSQIVVITDKHDAHLPFVEKHLAQPFIVIDPTTLIGSNRLSYVIRNNRIIITYGDTILDNVKSVWYRKPRTVTNDMIPLGANYKEYAGNALRHHIMLLLTSLPDALWVSDFYAIRRASDKPLQLEIASRLGFRVPDTLFTSDKEQAEQFITTHGTCIMKPIVPFLYSERSKQKSMYATKITKDTMPNLRNLAVSPMIFQQMITPVYDIRVTVVGEHVFAASIVTTGIDTKSPVRDWRIGHYQGDMHIAAIHDFPPDIAQLCVQHTQALGLTFGAIDMILDADGNYWFLENNPNGQWGFVERETSQPIGKALAELLEAGNASFSLK